jgi:hypothetical protein
MLRCGGLIDDLRPCDKRPRWRVMATGGLDAVDSCKYHLVDFVEQVTDRGVPAIVLQVDRMGE